MSALAARSPPTWIWLLPAVTLLLMLVALGVGAGQVGFADALDWLLQRADADTAMVVGELRLPRALKAIFIGAALGASGVILQAVTRNPLAEPGLLGVNSGAALAIALGLSLQGALTPQSQILWAIGGAVAGGVLVLLMARSGRLEAAPLRLLLAGLALAATSQSLTAWLSLSRAATLDQYRFWVLGSLSHPHSGLLVPALLLIVVGLLFAFALRAPLAALGLGDDLARALGHRPDWTRSMATALVAVLSGTAVALAGPIAFLGLIAPWAARACAGVALGPQLIAASGFGAILLLLADLAARILVAPYEAPVSALVALVGAPLLILMVRRDALLSLTRSGAEA